MLRVVKEPTRAQSLVKGEVTIQNFCCGDEGNLLYPQGYAFLNPSSQQEYSTSTTPFFLPPNHSNSSSKKQKKDLTRRVCRLMYLFSFVIHKYYLKSELEPKSTNGMNILNRRLRFMKISPHPLVEQRNELFVFAMDVCISMSITD